MAKKQKQSPYDSSSGAGTGDYLEGSPGTDIERAGPVRAMPGPTAADAFVEEAPHSSMLAAVLATLFCFFPLGLVAIIYALQVRPRWKRGDESGARHAAEMAEKLSFAAVGVTVILLVCGAIY